MDDFDAQTHPPSPPPPRLNPSVPLSYKHGGVVVGGHVALLLGFATPSTYSINGGTGKPPLFE